MNEYVREFSYYYCKTNAITILIHTRSLRSIDTAKYFPNGLAELIEIWHTVFHILAF
jgi:hypothetical protein